MADKLTGKFDRRLVVGAAILALILLSLLLFSVSRDGNAGNRKPDLLLMSSIPLIWGEASMADIANGAAKPAPLFEHLAKRNRVVLVDDFQKLGRPGSKPLLLVQPRALAPRELVELDGWIREGGTALIFADPALHWPSDLPLGDRRRPLFTSLLTPMFRHWGLDLALPVAEDLQDRNVTVGRYNLNPRSSGIWLVSTSAPAAKCRVRGDQIMAYCAVGKGRAVLIADADLLEAGRWTDGLMTSGTTAWLDALIDASRRSDSIPGNLWESAGKSE
jgi:hypothetical protein